MNINNNVTVNNNLVKLSSDYERSIRREISYQLRFLIMEMAPEFVVEHLFNIVINLVIKDRIIFT